MTQIAAIKCANAIMVGKETLVFIKDDYYDITLDKALIRVASKRDPSAVTFTSLYNTIYFLEAKPSEELPKGAKRAAR